MIIGIDASRSVESIQKTGVEKVSDELLLELQKQLTEHNRRIDLLFYTPQEIDWLPKENLKILHWPFNYFWTQIRLAWELIFHPPQVMFFPVHSVPIFLLLFNYFFRSTRYYKVIHDIAFKKRPDLYSFKKNLILNLDLWLALKLCSKVFAPSQAVRQDLTKYTNINSDKIEVVHWGYERKTQNSDNRTQKKKQILYIGRVEKKKNIDNLVAGFKIFNAKYPEYKLILAGKIDPKFPISNFQCLNNSQITNFKSNITVEFLGYVSDDKKKELLSESTALVLVSHEEGFGFPVLEAFDYQLPIIASDIPILREIGGNGCFYINQNSPEEIAVALEKIIADKNFTDALIRTGSEIVRSKFSWSTTTATIVKQLVS